MKLLLLTLGWTTTQFSFKLFAFGLGWAVQLKSF